MASLLDEVRELEAQRGRPPAPMGLSQQVREAEAERESGTHAQDPAQLNLETRESNMAAQVGQRELGPEGLDDFGLRADLSFSDRFDEKQEKFKAAYQDGDMTMVLDPGMTGRQGGTEILFRRNQNEPYGKVDAHALDVFDYLYDIGDVAADIPAVALEVLLTRGNALWKQGVGAFMGGAGGEAIKEGLESWRGYQRETFEEITTRAIQKGAMASMGAISTVALSGPINAFRGRTAIDVVPGAARAQMAAKSLGVPRLTPGQVASSPLWRRLQGLSAATVKNVGDYVREQMGASSRALMSMRDSDITRVLGGDLAKVHDDARKQLIEGVLRADPVDLSVGGTAIQTGIAEYDDLARTLVGRAYADARSLESPQFNISPSLAVADELEQGIRGAAREQGGGIRRMTDAEMAASGTKIRHWMTEEPTRGTVRLDPIKGALLDAVEDIKALDPSLPDIGSGTATDQLRALRSRLWDLKTPNPGEIARQEHFQAGRLFHSLNKVLDDPKNVAPEFREAWTKASTEARVRFETMDKLVVVRAGKSEDPTGLAKRFVAPFQADNLKLLKQVLPQGRWEEFKHAAMSHLTANGSVDNLTKTLTNYDNATLNTMFNRAEIGLLQGLGRNMDELNALGLPQIVERSTRRGDIAYDLLVSNNQKQIATFTKNISDNPKAAIIRKDLRAGLIDALISRHINRVEGVPTIQWKAFNADLDKLVENGGMRFLKAEDVRTLRDLRLVGEFLPQSADAGTSIAATETASAVTRRPLKTVLDVARQASIGRLMTTKTFQRLLLGSDDGPVKDLTFNALRAAGAVTAELLLDVRPGIPADREKETP